MLVGWTELTILCAVLSDGGGHGSGEVLVHVVEERGDKQLVWDRGGDHGTGVEGAGDSQVLGQVKCLTEGGRERRRGREGEEEREGGRERRRGREGGERGNISRQR